MVESEEIRVGESEAMFRDVNETLAAADSGWGSEPVALLCECADEFCTEDLFLTHAEYERLRAVAEHFAVAPEHVQAEFERVVETHAHYWVVEKLGAAGEIAEETDPRSDA